MLVTKSVFKLLFVLSNYQTCTFPLKYQTVGAVYFKRPVFTNMLGLCQFEALVTSVLIKCMKFLSHIPGTSGTSGISGTPFFFF